MENGRRLLGRDTVFPKFWHGGQYLAVAPYPLMLFVRVVYLNHSQKFNPRFLFTWLLIMGVLPLYSRWLAENPRCLTNQSKIDLPKLGTPIIPNHWIKSQELIETTIEPKFLGFVVSSHSFLGVLNGGYPKHPKTMGVLQVFKHRKSQVFDWDARTAAKPLSDGEYVNNV